MQTKHIEKLEELEGYKWGERNAYFQLRYNKEGKYLSLFQTNGKNLYGEYPVNNELKYINLKNLTELEFYGLKVVLNEKPKLTRKEKILIECHEDEFFIARSENNSLCIFEKMPQQCSLGHWGRIWGDDRLVINSELFPFITWESGKAWSKSELMELEVVE